MIRYISTTLTAIRKCACVSCACVRVLDYSNCISALDYYVFNDDKSLCVCVCVCVCEKRMLYLPSLSFCACVWEENRCQHACLSLSRRELLDVMIVGERQTILSYYGRNICNKKLFTVVFFCY